MKLLSIIFAALVLVTLLHAQDFSPDIAPLYTGPNWGSIVDTGITCTGGPNISIVRDDGTYENGYRSVTTGDSTTMVQKMVLPSGGTFTITQICVVWTALAPSGNITFDLIIYDTTGSVGTEPGNVVYRVNNVVGNNVAIFPLHSRYSFPINFAATQRAYFVGVRWNNNPILPFFFSADENGPVSTMGPGYQRITTTYPPIWQNITPPFTLWKSFGVRLEGWIAYPPPPRPQITRCRNGLNKLIPDHGTLLDSVEAVIFIPCYTVFDVNLRIDTVLHTWDSDLRFYLRKGNTGVLIIDHAGGSGDNFIGTTLNDSASIPISSGIAPFTGSYRPQNPLTPFNGFYSTNNYFWKLAITDTAGGDTGLLKAWCIVLTYETCEGIQQTIEVANYYSLQQNYPNPFNPVTNIKFSVPLSGQVRLVIFDILGKEVEVLLNEYKHPGVYNVDFDASHLSSGIYFYRLEANDYVQTKKMLLVK
jgi:Secretion system C-terminal sorting domain